MQTTPAVMPTTRNPPRPWTFHGAVYLRAAGRVGARYRTVVGADVVSPGPPSAAVVGRAVVSFDVDPGAGVAAHPARFAAWPSPRGPGLTTLAAVLVTDAPPYGLGSGDLVLSGSCRVTTAAWAPGDAEGAVASWLAAPHAAPGGC